MTKYGEIKCENNYQKRQSTTRQSMKLCKMVCFSCNQIKDTQMLKEDGKKPLNIPFTKICTDLFMDAIFYDLLP